MTRRTFVHLGAAAAASAPFAFGPSRAGAALADRRYLFVVGGLGGASIVDSFLAVPESASSRGAELTTHPDAQIVAMPGTELRCVRPYELEDRGYRFGNGYSQEEFLRRFRSDLAVVTCEASTVNHATGQVRALTGDGVNRGRTLLEAAGERWGSGLPLPVVNMAAAGYASEGSDPSLSVGARQTVVPDPRFFALSTHGSAGIPGALAPPLRDRVRAARARFERGSAFGRTFGESESVRAHRQLRERAAAMEAADLVSSLGMWPRDARTREFGLAPSPEAERLATAFGNLATDSFEAQAALAFLLARYEVSCAIAISPSAALESAVEIGGRRTVTNTQLAFDYSHTDHRLAQSVMWSRVLRVIDSLISLLRDTPLDGARPELGTMWDRSLVYVATEFGRQKTRPRGAVVYPTAHHQNNAVVLLSPLVRGDAVYGGVHPESCLTFGFDPVTGAPVRPRAGDGTVAPDEQMSMRDVYAIVAGALDVDYEGRRAFPSVIRG